VVPLCTAAEVPTCLLYGMSAAVSAAVCLRYLRPGDSLPIGTPDADVKPLALPEGWREAYAGGRGPGGGVQHHAQQPAWRLT
jgi:hypothetical protein